MNSSAHIVVDMLYDFIDGSMACLNAQEAVEESIKFINNNPNQPVFYIADSHPSNHCSFVEQGGIWPPHCVKGTHGAEIDQKYTTDIKNELNRPNNNILKKGEDPLTEQYSGFEAVSPQGKTLQEYLLQRGYTNLYISGIATEYCIKATATDLKKAGFNVNVIEEGLAYVDAQGHKESVKELAEAGVNII